MSRIEEILVMLVGEEMPSPGSVSGRERAREVGLVGVEVSPTSRLCRMDEKLLMELAYKQIFTKVKPVLKTKSFYHL